MKAQPIPDRIVDVVLSYKASTKKKKLTKAKKAVRDKKQKQTKR